MATNYTTKTAALKATRADIRKVTAKTVMVDDRDGVSTNVVDLIDKAQEAATITVGRDADKNWVVDDTVIDTVKKINFLGDYVNVVQSTTNPSEISLYIGENKSNPEVSSNILSGVPANSSSKVYVYADATDNFALPVTTGNQTTYYKKVAADSGFGSVTMTAKSTTNANVFTLNSTDFIWVRVKYNNGSYSAWGKVSLAVNRGTYTPSNSTPSAVAFSANTEAGEVALPSGITMNIGNYVLTAEADAQRGKVPGRCETQFNITMNLDTIATLDGGIIDFDWAISMDEPTSPKTTKFFITEEKTPAIASVALEDITCASPAVISGLSYRTSGTTATLTTGNITNTQYKSAAGLARLGINAAGTSTTKSITTIDEGEMTLADGSVAATASGATYTYTGTVTLGSTGNAGTGTVTVTPKGAKDGSTKSATVSQFWGNPSASLSTTVEPWGKETYRYADIAATTAWTAADDVTTKSLTVNGTATVGAVAQYGSLMHPSQAVADMNGKTYTTSSAASYVRKFSGLSNSGSGFTISGDNIGAAGIKVYWYEESNGVLVELTDATNANNTVSANKLIHAINLATEKSTSAPILIFVIPAGSTTKIGKVTVTGGV